MRPASPLLASLLVLFLSLGRQVWAQSYRSLRGTVSDKSGATVNGARVTLSSPERAIERTATTGQAGEYEFSQLAPGTYQLVVEMPGFKKYEQRNIQLLVNNP